MTRIRIIVRSLFKNRVTSVITIAGLAACMIALLTVSWQSWRAATRNPVEALRYE